VDEPSRLVGARQDAVTQNSWFLSSAVVDGRAGRICPPLVSGSFEWALLPEGGRGSALSGSCDVGDIALPRTAHGLRRWQHRGTPDGSASRPYLFFVVTYAVGEDGRAGAVGRADRSVGSDRSVRLGKAAARKRPAPTQLFRRTSLV